jgi:hypothetical protein
MAVRRVDAGHGHRRKDGGSEGLDAGAERRSGPDILSRALPYYICPWRALHPTGCDLARRRLSASTLLSGRRVHSISTSKRSHRYAVVRHCPGKNKMKSAAARAQLAS